MHTTTIHVRWGELDPYHHVNHATYLSYLEHARISALESIGWGMDRLGAAGYQVVVVGIEIRFRRPATAGDTLTIESAVAHLGASESSWRQVIRRGAPEQPLVGRKRGEDARLVRVEVMRLLDGNEDARVGGQPRCKRGRAAFGRAQDEEVGPAHYEADRSGSGNAKLTRPVRM